MFTPKETPPHSRTARARVITLLLPSSEGNMNKQIMICYAKRDTSPHQDSASTVPSGTPPPAQPPPAPPDTIEEFKWQK